MLCIERILGSRREPDVSDRLHHLEHYGKVDVVEISAADLDRRRLLITTAGGTQLAIALPRDQKLFDGAVLVLDEAQAIVVRAAPQRWLRLAPRSIHDAIELGYHAGNFHWRVQFDGEVLLVALDGLPEDYTARIDGLISTRRVGASVVDAPRAGTGVHPIQAHHHG